jgi:hypothetical protein
MEPLWSPVVATNGNRSQIEPPREPQRNKPKPLPWVATACRDERMVRRGSTVRVRQRALKSPEIGIFVVWGDMTEHLLFREGVTRPDARSEGLVNGFNKARRELRYALRTETRWGQVLGTVPSGAVTCECPLAPNGKLMRKGHPKTKLEPLRRRARRRARSRRTTHPLKP